MKLDLHDKNGKVIDAFDVDDGLFGVIPNETLLAQYVRVYQTNQRQGTSKVKTRGDVSGGGKKPWKQKGLGRARHGSTRSPLWRHGGITHGPQPRLWAKTLTKKMRKLALASALSIKVNKSDLLVLNDFAFKKPNTKDLLKVLQSTNSYNRRTLIVLNTNDMTIRRSAENLAGVTTALAANLNTYEVMLANKVVFLGDAVRSLETRYSSSVEAKATSTKTDTKAKKVPAKTKPKKDKVEKK